MDFTTHNLAESGESRQQRMRRLSLPINLIQYQHELPSLVFGPRGKTLFQEHCQRTDMLTPTLSELLPRIPLA